MENKFLVVFEISQKQAYIFDSNKLIDNISNSSIIEYVTSCEYFEKKCGRIFNKDKNLVYVGGGHSVLEFDDGKSAMEFAKVITLAIREEYRGLEAFIKINKYDYNLTPTMNIELLISDLEKKKALRRAYFKQGNFGVEKLNSSTFELELINNATQKSRYNLESDYKAYKLANLFDDLGGTEGVSNFISVVHIDGNSMGKRVKEFRDNLGVNCTWSEFKTKSREFSEAIDNDYKLAYEEMMDEVIEGIINGKFKELSLKEKNLPVRKIIRAGDDICFVAEGRIGIECARIFIEKLWSKVNPVDKKNYASCAGVAIVHKKFPFYRAYELSEQLCNNAKTMIVNLGDKLNISGNASAIDWHIEYGEMKDSLADIREMYNTMDGGRLELKPYIICGDDIYTNAEIYRNYYKFKKMIDSVKNKGEGVARGKLKEMRYVLKQGKISTKYFIQANKLDDFAINPINEIFNDITEIQINSNHIGLSRDLFIKTMDDESRCLIFDALELADNYISMD